MAINAARPGVPLYAVPSGAGGLDHIHANTRTTLAIGMAMPTIAPKVANRRTLCDILQGISLEVSSGGTYGSMSLLNFWWSSVKLDSNLFGRMFSLPVTSCPSFYP
jgi:hypothetical protein